MQNDTLVHKDYCCVSGKDYEIAVYSRDGRHYAKTVLAPEDVIISDGLTKEEVLARHQRLLPLAINSRQIVCEHRKSFAVET